MSQHEFCVDPLLSRQLLVAQGDPSDKLAKLPDREFVATGVEAGARVIAAVADFGYRIQHDTYRSSGEQGQLSDVPTVTSKVVMARFKEGECVWFEPKLARTLAFDLGIENLNENDLLFALGKQLFQFSNLHPITGNFGKVTIDKSTGEMSVEVSPPVRLGQFID